MQSEIIFFVVLTLTFVLASQGSENEDHIGIGKKINYSAMKFRRSKRSEEYVDDEETKSNIQFQREGDKSSYHDDSHDNSRKSATTSIFTQSGTGVVIGLRALCALLCMFVAY
jgi:hypothetical protein